MAPLAFKPQVCVRMKPHMGADHQGADHQGADLDKTLYNLNIRHNALQGLQDYCISLPLSSSVLWRLSCVHVLQQRLQTTFRL